MKVTQTHGNKRNGIPIGSTRITIRADNRELMDQFIVSVRDAQGYCERWRGGAYGKRYAAAVERANKLDRGAHTLETIGHEGARLIKCKKPRISKKKAKPA